MLLRHFNVTLSYFLTRQQANKIPSNIQNPRQKQRISLICKLGNLYEITEQIPYLDKIICHNDIEVEQRPTWLMTCAEPSTHVGITNI